MNVHAPHFKSSQMLTLHDMRRVELELEAVRVFGSTKKAKSWLKTKLSILNSLTPSEALQSADGQKQVALLLGQIDHGIFS